MIVYACLGTAHEYHGKVLAKIEQETVLLSFVDIDRESISRTSLFDGDYV
jgi:hypothetical protein